MAAWRSERSPVRECVTGGEGLHDFGWRVCPLPLPPPQLFYFRFCLALASHLARAFVPKLGDESARAHPGLVVAESAKSKRLTSLGGTAALLSARPDMSKPLHFLVFFFSFRTFCSDGRIFREKSHDSDFFSILCRAPVFFSASALCMKGLFKMVDCSRGLLL